MPSESDTIVAAPKRRGRPKKAQDIVVTPVRQVCQWCKTEVLPGQEPRIWVTCAACQRIDDAYEAEVPCENCGGRKSRSVAGVELKDGHRDSCLTRAEPVGARR
jgi:hypothetical protein